MNYALCTTLVGMGLGVCNYDFDNVLEWHDANKQLVSFKDVLYSSLMIIVRLIMQPNGRQMISSSRIV